jgi:hypothetical protein
MRSEPVPTMAKAEAGTSEFSTRWDEMPTLKKQDRLALLVREADWRPALEPGPIPKHPEPDMVPPVKMPAIVAVPNEDDDIGRRPVSRRAHRTRNICTRHQMRKIITNRGRSWHCKR